MYYPKSKISENQYTGGGLLKDTTTGDTFRGYYHLTFDGRYFTGATHSISSTELILLQPASITTGGSDSIVTAPFVANFNYDTITNGKMSFLNQGSIPTPIYPTPTADDYNTGQFTRYFMQRIGGGASDIREISKDGVQLLSKNPLYTTLSLIWKLTGPENDVKLPSYTVYGVASTNLRTVQSLDRTMKGIKQYLGNPLELAKIIFIPVNQIPARPKLPIFLTQYNQDQPINVPLVDNGLIDFDGGFLIDSDGGYLLNS